MPDRPSLTPADASALAARVRTGDERAFHTLYIVYFHTLCAFTRTLTNSRETAEEYVQDVFADWWERRATIRIEHGVRAYLYGAVRYRVFNARRHDRVVQAQAAIAIQSDEPIGMGTPDPSAATTVELTEFSTAVAHAIAALPPARRTALILRVTHGLDYTEIAATMGISPQAAMTHVSRARSALRPLFDEFFRPE
ncbi:MAG TPA: sigma-70 family RNA polymerase sigma factor [Gemmatimonadaceae bacterium]|nr:sigma-70 family RNA polymerase sigma factor [Gemmatimonadaceae bacterium]